MSYAFIAYAQPDRLLAVRLWDELRWRGLDIGIDLRDVPAHLDRSAVMEDLISGCNTLLLLLSRHTATHRELRRLHLLAIEQDCELIALLLPGGELPKSLRCAKTLAFGNYERGFKHLLRLLPPDELHRAPDPRRVLENLRHESADVRRTNLHLVASEHITSATPRAITLLLTDDDEQVRAAAAWALDQLNNIETAPALLLALQDESENVRVNAGWGLVRMGRRKDAPASRALVPALIDLMRTDGYKHHTRQTAYIVLRRIGGPRANDAIDRYWKKK